MKPGPNQIDALDRFIDMVLDDEQPTDTSDGGVDPPTAQVVTDLHALVEATPVRADLVAELEARVLFGEGEHPVRVVDARAGQDAIMVNRRALRGRPARFPVRIPALSQWAYHARNAGVRISSLAGRSVRRGAYAVALSLFLVLVLLGAASIAAAAPLRQSLTTALNTLQAKVQIIGRSQGWPIRLDTQSPVPATQSNAPDLAAAAHTVGFRPLAPASLPSGYHLQNIQALGPGSVAFRRADGTAMPGTIQVFEGTAGMLMILQIQTEEGTFNWTAADASYRPITIRGREGWFVDGYWEQQGNQTVWKTGEEGAFRQLIWSDQHFTYMIRGHLGRDELLRVADGLR